jgi:hypothetical protein
MSMRVGFWTGMHIYMEEINPPDVGNAINSRIFFSLFLGEITQKTAQKSIG